MNLDETFRDQTFEFNPGLLQLHTINQNIFSEWCVKEIMGNQLRILQFLQTGKIDEDKVISDLGATLAKLSERSTRDYYDTLADLQKRPDNPDAPAE